MQCGAGCVREIELAKQDEAAASQDPNSQETMKQCVTPSDDGKTLASQASRQKTDTLGLRIMDCGCNCRNNQTVQITVHRWLHGCFIAWMEKDGEVKSSSEVSTPESAWV